MYQPEQYGSIGKSEIRRVDDSTPQGGPPDAEALPSNQWTLLVERIRQNDPQALQELYQVFGRGVRMYLCRQLGMQDLDDKVHDTFLIVVQAIQRGELREPDRLMGFVRTIARRLVAGHIDTMVHSRRDTVAVDSGVMISDQANTPEQSVIKRQKIDLMLDVLREMGGRDREILTRFYLYEESQEKIGQEMNLTATQFRLLKSRAKARFAELGRKKLEKKSSLRNFGLFLH